MDALGEVSSRYLTQVIGDMPDSDVKRADALAFVSKIHELQHTIMGQAAARAYPEFYRRQGESGE